MLPTIIHGVGCVPYYYVYNIAYIPQRVGIFANGDFPNIEYLLHAIYKNHFRKKGQQM